MKTTPVRNWSETKHGTRHQFINDRMAALCSRNLEQREAAVLELHAMQVQLVMDCGFSVESRRILPSPKTSSHRRITKYFSAMHIWETELLTWEEREAFVATTFLWTS